MLLDTGNNLSSSIIMSEELARQLQLPVEPIQVGAKEAQMKVSDHSFNIDFWLGKQCPAKITSAWVVPRNPWTWEWHSRGQHRADWLWPWFKDIPLDKYVASHGTIGWDGMWICQVRGWREKVHEAVKLEVWGVKGTSMRAELRTIMKHLPQE